MRSPEAVHAVVKAYDIRGVVGESIDAEFMYDTGAAFGRLIYGEGSRLLAIGHDMRPSSPELSQTFADGAASQGVDVIQLGLASTDELYYASGVLECAGAMFTASHNPAQYNGIKLCRSGAKPVGQETGLADITDMLIEGVPLFDGQPGCTESRDVLEGYVDYLKNLVDISAIRPLRVAIDAANGMAGLTAPAVFAETPVEVKDLYFELDGTFPNHEANPLDPKNLEDLQRFVVDTGADVGLAFDGDADRCFVVDEKGQPVSPSAICALIAERTLAEHPGATIIHNLITSKSVPEIIAENGGTAERTRVGHSFIKKTMADTGAKFGGEHSAHYYFTDFFNADSGMLAALHVLAALGEQDGPLSELMARYTRYAASGEINSVLENAQQQEERREAVVEAFADRTESIDRLDGVTVELAGTPAWFNVRASNTEPLLRLNVEAPTEADVQELVTEILGIIRA
ncbi:Phosphomannomutase/phosphoglucomutase [Corynebacterium ciconiae DSM 44920]|uniref:phosphomannomutase/phosphoglucomutase n=1 Tax=Corynebacterium ciconiae TaxID=227319 RepID=UPI00036A7833|nr:phosphomannomutase/phosphoglucomutase [Corynebacterium ciconiae]WKD61811.1 Phosphomannomutase/phosphoglucomutase [Corynebacterium ciconiae DSM 44920]